MILLLARRPDDPSLQRLADTIRTAGGHPILVTLTDMEQLSSFQIQPHAQHGATCTLRLGEMTIDLRDLRAAWLWRHWQPLAVDPSFQAVHAHRAQWGFVDQEWRALYRGFIMTLAHAGVFCVNPPPFSSAFEEKCCQLLLAAQVGLTIPPTLYTARLPLAQEFAAQHQDAIIYKPFKGFTSVSAPLDDGSVRVGRVLTNRVAPADLQEAPGFVPTPGIFQPYIDKAFELRIVVVGQRIFACAIHSQHSARSRDDWRRYDLDHTPYEPYDLPASIQAQILLLMERMHLVFGSIDMIVTPTGEYVFLEVNPNGQFDWVVHRLDLPIYDYLAQMLMQATPHYHLPAPQEIAPC